MTVPKVCLALLVGLILICVLCNSDDEVESIESLLSMLIVDECDDRSDLSEVNDAEGVTNDDEFDTESYVFRRIDFRCKSLSIRTRASSNWFSRSRIRRFCGCDWLRIPV